MGRATYEARHSLATYYDQHAQQAVLLAKDPTQNTYFQAHTSYGDSEYEHVEKILFGMLWDRYSGFQNIPNNTTIIVAGKWSPCKHCTAKTIPEFFQFAKAAERNLIVKFRFEKFYTKSAWTETGASIRAEGGKQFWDDDHSAAAAYESLSSKYGTFQSAPEPLFCDPVDGPIFKVKNKRRLSIWQADVSIKSDYTLQRQ